MFKPSFLRITIFAAASLISSVALTGISSLPANAADQGCTGTVDGSDVFGSCGTGSSGSGSGAGNFNHDYDLFIPTGALCVVDAPGIIPYESYMVRGRYASTQTWNPNPFCLREDAKEVPGNIGNVIQQAKLTPPKPSVTTDYKGPFLTGAEITFDLGSVNAVSQPIPGFTGYSLASTPKEMTIDFGDGQSQTWTGSTTPTSVTHVYEKKPKSGDANQPATITVNLSVRWGNSLVGGVSDLPDITTTTTMTKPVIEVWSALMEPQ